VSARLLLRPAAGIFYIAEPDMVSVLASMHHAREPLQWQRCD